MIIMSGPSRGVASGAAASGGGGFTGSELLSLNVANDGVAGYRYWDPEDNYLGAFVPEADPGGVDSMYDSMGPIALNPASNTIFVAGHYTQITVAEFEIPVLVNVTDRADLGDLNVGAAVQNFRSFNNVGTGDDLDVRDPPGEGLIAGLYYNADRLLITTFDHYGQDESYKSIFRVVRDADNLAGTVDGYFDTLFAGAAGGWTSEIPVSFQSDLGGTHISGFTNSGGRRSSTQALSCGGAAYVGNIGALMANSHTAPANYLSGGNAQIEIMRYGTEPNGYMDDEELYNWAGSAVITTNPLWTMDSEFSYGEIVPGTRSYILFGSQVGAEHGMWYGNNTNRPPEIPYDPDYDNQGPHPRNTGDVRFFYMIYDVADMIALKNGVAPDSWAIRYAAKYGSTPRALLPHEIQPYEWGTLWMPFFQPGNKDIGGGARDKENGILYLSQARWDNTQGYDTPVIVAFSLGW